MDLNICLLRRVLATVLRSWCALLWNNPSRPYMFSAIRPGLGWWTGFVLTWKVRMTSVRCHALIFWHKFPVFGRQVWRCRVLPLSVGATGHSWCKCSYVCSAKPSTPSSNGSRGHSKSPACSQFVSYHLFFSCFCRVSLNEYSWFCLKLCVFVFSWCLLSLFFRYPTPALFLPRFV